MSKRVLIADDHPIFRRGLREVVEEDGVHQVTGEAADGLSAMAMARRLQPEVAIVDLSMPGADGFEVAAWLRQNQPHCRVVIMTMHTEEALVDRALQLEIAGYLLKDDAYGEVRRCLEVVLNGGCYLSPSIGAERALQTPQPPSSAAPPEDEEKIARLTPTQREVLRHLAAYRTSKEIARLMQLSHRTVQNHRSNIAETLGLHGRNRLLEFAARMRDWL